MRTVTISSKGQISIPKEVRESLHISDGDKLIFNVKDGKILLEPVINIPRSQAWFWSKKWQEQIKQSMEDIEKGRIKVFKSAKGAKRYFGD